MTRTTGHHRSRNNYAFPHKPKKLSHFLPIRSFPLVSFFQEELSTSKSAQSRPHTRQAKHNDEICTVICFQVGVEDESVNNPFLSARDSVRLSIEFVFMRSLFLF